MKLSHYVVGIFAVLILSATALAQGSSPLVTVQPIDTIVVARGGKAPLNIMLRINKGFHINSNKPNNEFFMPTTVHLNPPEGIMIVNVHYPVGEQLALPFMGNEKLSAYSGIFEIKAEVRVPKSAALGTLRVHGDVKYQACDNRQCFPPKTTPLEFDVTVVKSTSTSASPRIR